MRGRFRGAYGSRRRRARASHTWRLTTYTILRRPAWRLMHMYKIIRHSAGKPGPPAQAGAGMRRRNSRAGFSPPQRRKSRAGFRPPRRKSRAGFRPPHRAAATVARAPARRAAATVGRASARPNAIRPSPARPGRPRRKSRAGFRPPHRAARVGRTSARRAARVGRASARPSAIHPSPARPGDARQGRCAILRVNRALQRGRVGTSQTLRAQPRRGLHTLSQGFSPQSAGAGRRRR